MSERSDDVGEAGSKAPRGNDRAFDDNTAAWLIDLGPEGGAGGGQIIATGTPEQVAKNPASFTGKYLAPLLKKK